MEVPNNLLYFKPSSCRRLDTKVQSLRFEILVVQQLAVWNIALPVIWEQTG